MFLLDTNVVFELRRPKPHGGVVAWLRSLNDSGIFISAVTIGEIQRGIEIARESDGDRAAELQAWLLEVERSSSILPLDSATLRIWAAQMHGLPDALMLDAMIAATAIAHGLCVATRNTKDFKHFDVEVLDPFASSAGR